MFHVQSLLSTRKFLGAAGTLAPALGNSHISPKRRRDMGHPLFVVAKQFHCSRAGVGSVEYGDSV
jgi:hypothetical protein